MGGFLLVFTKKKSKVVFLWVKMMNIRAIERSYPIKNIKSSFFLGLCPFLLLKLLTVLLEKLGADSFDVICANG